MFHPIQDVPCKHPGKRCKSSYRDSHGVREEARIFLSPTWKARGSIWAYNTGYGHTTSDKYAFEHHSLMPEKLAEDLILSWSDPGDTILDPFAGAGTTGKMALKNGRRFIGIEKNEAFFRLMERRMKEVSDV